MYLSMKNTSESVRTIICEFKIIKYFFFNEINFVFNPLNNNIKFFKCF
jgi:hypothetical protein